MSDQKKLVTEFLDLVIFLRENFNCQMRLAHDAPVVAVIAAAVDHALRALRSDGPVATMAHQAEETNDSLEPVSKGPFDAKSYVLDDFLPSITKTFPPIFVDEVLQSEKSTVMAQACRDKGPKDSYCDNMRILVNAALIYDIMGAKALGAERRYRKCMFKLCATMMHEIQHILTAFVGGRVVGTPKKINAHLVVQEKDAKERPKPQKPEAGQHFEAKYFGGKTWDQPTYGQRSKDPGEPLLIRPYQKRNEVGYLAEIIEDDAIMSFLCSGKCFYHIQRQLPNRLQISISLTDLRQKTRMSVICLILLR